MDSFRLRCLQHTISRSLLLCLLTASSAAAAKSDIVVQNEGPEARPDLIFACDRPTAELHALFTPELIADLQQLKAGVALSTEDLSPERASVVRELNTAGIPMIAWLALPKSEGYYINADNASQTAAFFAQFDAWTRANGLHWEAVGLDIESTMEHEA